MSFIKTLSDPDQSDQRKPQERAGVIAKLVCDFNEELHNQTLREEGMEEGIMHDREEIITHMLELGKNTDEIAYPSGIPLETVNEIAAGIGR